MFLRYLGDVNHHFLHFCSWHFSREFPRRTKRFFSWTFFHVLLHQWNWYFSIKVKQQISFGFNPFFFTVISFCCLGKGLSFLPWCYILGTFFYYFKVGEVILRNEFFLQIFIPIARLTGIRLVDFAVGIRPNLLLLHMLFIYKPTHIFGTQPKSHTLLGYNCFVNFCYFLIGFSIIALPWSTLGP